MQSVNQNIDKLLNLANRSGVISGENKLLKSTLSKMFAKSTMHKQVENVVCKMIAEFETVSTEKEIKNG
ncbi:MAG: hypothetical protein ACEPO8_01870 [Rhodothermaceae bacterium]